MRLQRLLVRLPLSPVVLLLFRLLPFQGVVCVMLGVRALLSPGPDECRCP
jgi:hypothetical protein